MFCCVRSAAAAGLRRYHFGCLYIFLRPLATVLIRRTCPFSKEITCLSSLIKNVVKMLLNFDKMFDQFKKKNRNFDS